MTTTLGAAASSRSLRDRPMTIGIPMTSKKFGETTMRWMLLPAVCRPAGYIRPWT
jgi:hypothetical protein